MSFPIRRALGAFLVIGAMHFSISPAIFSNSAFAQQSKPAAIVNGEAITDAEVKLAIEDLVTQYPQLPAERRADVALDFLIEVKLASQAARKDKLDQTEDFRLKIAYARDRVLMERLLAREGEKSNTEAALRKFYDEQVGQIKPMEEVRARHILVEGEEEAKKISARIKAGEDFAKLAAELSKDPGSGKEGGDLGYFTRDRMVPEFAEAAYALKNGEVSPPVKSQFGWHIIKTEDKRLRPPPSFEAVKDQLGQAVANKAQSDFIAELRKAAKIEKRDASPEKKQ